jgi:hypothetical protein
MNRTLKDATVKRYHYDSHDQLRTHLQLFLDAYNHARRLKTLRGLTPYEHVVQVWTKEPERFRLDPSHHIPGPYSPRRWSFPPPTMRRSRRLSRLCRGLARRTQRRSGDHQRHYPHAAPRGTLADVPGLSRPHPTI